MGFLYLLVVIAMITAIALPAIDSGHAPPPWFIAAGIVGFCILFILIYIGTKVMQHQFWARPAGIEAAVLMLPSAPFGTIAGLYVLYHLIGGWDLHDGRIA